MNLNPRNFGLAAGVLWGFSLLLMTLISVGTGYASEFLEVIASIYPGYSISLLGSIIGLVYGFIDGFIGVFIFAWLYNWLETKK
ncbi:MAG: bacteriophage holin [Candidatus Scalinduaceae bacterium]